MISRRRAVAWLATAPLTTLASAGDAVAAPPLGAVLDGHVSPNSGGGLYPLRGRSDFVRLGAPLAVLHRTVFSMANANDRYLACVQLGVLPTRSSFLPVTSGVLSSDSWGSGFGGEAPGATTFRTDRALADEIAALWKVPRLDRTPLGAGLGGRFQPKSRPFIAGAPMEIALQVENKGTSTVGFSVGGHTRGPRDNRFSFIVEQGGTALPVLRAFDFGGLMQYVGIAPGATTQVTADLASWTPLTTPGTYRVHCRYEAQVTPGAGISPSWPDHGHEIWDLTLTESIDITVA